MLVAQVERAVVISLRGPGSRGVALGWPPGELAGSAGARRGVRKRVVRLSVCDVACAQEASQKVLAARPQTDKDVAGCQAVRLWQAGAGGRPAPLPAGSPAAVYFGTRPGYHSLPGT